MRTQQRPIPSSPPSSPPPSSPPPSSPPVFAVTDFNSYSRSPGSLADSTEDNFFQDEDGNLFRLYLPVAAHLDQAEIQQEELSETLQPFSQLCSSAQNIETSPTRETSLRKRYRDSTPSPRGSPAPASESINNKISPSPHQKKKRGKNFTQEQHKIIEKFFLKGMIDGKRQTEPLRRRAAAATSLTDKQIQVYRPTITTIVVYLIDSIVASNTEYEKILY